MTVLYSKIDWEKIGDLFTYNPKSPLIFSSGLFLVLFTGFFIFYYFLRHDKYVKLSTNTKWLFTLFSTTLISIISYNSRPLIFENIPIDYFNLFVYFLFFMLLFLGLIAGLLKKKVLSHFSTLFYFSLFTALVLSLFIFLYVGKNFINLFLDIINSSPSIIQVILYFLFILSICYLFFFNILKYKINIRFFYVFLFSLFFYYKSSGAFFMLLVSCVFIDFYLAKWTDKTENKNMRLLYLVLSIVYNLGVLIYFKYTNFFYEIYTEISDKPFSPLLIILPVGVSFFTFQSLSYTIDVYRRHIKPIDSILDYGFYLTFFPQLVAGPIVRAVDFLPQLKKPVYVSDKMLGVAIFLIGGGLFKKAIIADYISINFVDRVFDNPSLYSGIENLFGVYGYALQIYCDFSGYSDIAIGIALLLGYHFNQNFDSPYQSKNITEFWRRWHISLSSWLKDYLYISMGGNRKGSIAGFFFTGLFFITLWIYAIYYYLHDASSGLMANYIPLLIASFTSFAFLIAFLIQKSRQKAFSTNTNLLTTMLLGGLWHGAAMRFIIWGALHGMGLIIHKVFMDIFPGVSQSKKRWVNLIALLITFHFVCFCWIFFRADNMKIVESMLHQILYNFNGHVFWQMVDGYKTTFILLFIGYFLHFIPDSLVSKYEKWISNWPLLIKAFYLVAIIILVVQFKSSEVQPFIYFQF